MSRAALLVMLAACGRIGFDELGAPGDGSGDASIADDGLVLHLTFEADGFLVDRSPFAHTATCVGPCPASVTDGPRGDAAQFDGQSCLQIADAPELRPPQLTFATWARFDVGQQGNFIGRPLDGDTSADNTFEAFAKAPNEVVVHMQSSVGTVTTGDGAWHHVAGTFDGDSLVVYFDGKRQSTLSADAVFANGDATLVGCDRDAGSFLDFLTGEVDDVRIYGRALTPDEIETLATP